MKFNFVVLALLVTAGTAVANIYPRQVDFSGVTSTVDITLQAPLGPGGLTPNSLHLGGINGVTLQYDPSPGTLLTDTASADSFGIFGSTTGALNLYFDQPAVGLRLNFSELGSLVAVFSNPLSTTSVTYDGTLTSYNLNYVTTSPFTLVTLFPSTAGPFFTIDPIIQFDSTVVPEPASFLLPMGMGMLGLGFARRFTKRGA